MYTPKEDRGSGEILMFLRDVLPDLFAVEDGSTFRVSDIGCGDRAWAKGLAKLVSPKLKDIMYLGFDSNLDCKQYERIEVYTQLETSVEKSHRTTFKERVRRVDFELYQDLDSLYSTSFGPGVNPNLLLFMETYEHLSEGKGLDVLTKHLNGGIPILFSAAIPDQPGKGHVNCKWLSDILIEVSNAGTEFHVVDLVRPHLWASSTVDVWYIQNTVLLLPNSVAEYLIEDIEALCCRMHTPKYLSYPAQLKEIDMVHPIAYEIITKGVTK